MLPRPHRLRRSADFSMTIRQGRRASSSTVVVHACQRGSTDPTQIGFVVARNVGTAVQRNRVKRRLRHLAAPLVGTHQTGLTVVVRANREAATATGAKLRTDLDRCISRVVG